MLIMVLFCGLLLLVMFYLMFYPVMNITVNMPPQANYTLDVGQNIMRIYNATGGLI